MAIKRIAGFAVSLIAVVALTSAARAEIKTEWIEYSHDGAKLKAYVAHDDKATGRRPAVFMVHRRNGMDAETLKNTEMWARLGYVVMAVDMFGYGSGILPKDVPAMQALTQIYNKDRGLMKARAQAGLDLLRQQPAVDAGKIALIGYCFGGTVGVEMAYAGTPLLATVTIHGSFRNHDPNGAKNVKGKFLILHGAEDTAAPLPEVDKIIGALRAAKVPFQYELYSGTAHGFSTPKNKDEERANVQSIGATTRFLKEVFGS
jgi:dienelactone hydrolase